MQELESICSFSAVSLWEISIKYSLDKMDLKGIKPDGLYVQTKDAGFEVLHLDTDLISTLHKLPVIKNKDPFDRMLAWQAINEDCVLITADRGFADYKAHGLKTIWQG